jgi:hypothetical protein
MIPSLVAGLLLDPWERRLRWERFLRVQGVWALHRQEWEEEASQDQ